MYRKLNGVILERRSGAEDYLLSKKKKNQKPLLSHRIFIKKEIIQDTPTA